MGSHGSLELDVSGVTCTNFTLNFKDFKAQQYSATVQDVKEMSAQPTKLALDSLL